MNLLKTLTIILIVIITLNLILFVLGKIHPMVFWVTIIVMAIFAYKVLPSIRKKLKSN